MAAAPAIAYHRDMYEILLDQAMWDATQGGPIDWDPNTSWRATGLDPSLFPQGHIPMKRVLLEHGENTHSIAGKYFAKAHRAGNVNGPPRFLLQFKIPPTDLVPHLFAGSVQINPHIETLAFSMVINLQNYPGLIDGIVHPLSEDVGQQLLKVGYAACDISASEQADPFRLY